VKTRRPFAQIPSIALASLIVAGAGTWAVAAPAYAAESITCTSSTPPESRTLSGSGPFEFLNSSSYCQGFNVTTTIPVVDGPVTDGISLKKSLDESTFTQVVTGSDWVNQSGVLWENTQAGIQVTATAGTSGTMTVEFYRFTSSTTPTYTYTVTVGSGGGGGGGDTPSGDDTPGTVVSGPGPHIQQFAMPATGTCDDAQPEGLNWGGASSGGWSESWAQWMHEGQGGAVCTRTLAYSTSTGTWEVQ